MSPALRSRIGAFSWGQQRFDTTEDSAASGHSATRLGAPPRWTASISCTELVEPELAGEWTALLAKLRGRINHLAVPYLPRLTPRGTARGTLTLASTAAVGAASLSIAGARGTNALLGGSFEVDSNADGLADGWIRLSAGSTGTLTALLDADGTYIVHGTRSQFLRAAALAAGSGNLHGIYQIGVPVTHLAGQTVTAAVQVAGTMGTTLAIYVTWQAAGGGAIVGSDLFASIGANGGVQQLSGSVLCPANAATAYVEVRQSNGSGGVAAVYVDGFRLVAGSAAPTYPGLPTLLAGDWLQVGTGVGSHFCMATDDAMATDAGRITVAIESGLRAAIASGTAVTYESPLCYMKQRPDAQSWQSRSSYGHLGGVTLELMEDWTA